MIEPKLHINNSAIHPVVNIKSGKENKNDDDDDDDEVT